MSKVYPEYANRSVVFNGRGGNEICIHLDVDGKVTATFVYTFITPNYCTLTELPERQVAELLEGDFKREVREN